MGERLNTILNDLLKAISDFLAHYKGLPVLIGVGLVLIGLIFNFLGRRYFVFPETPSGPWKPQVNSNRTMTRMRAK